MTPDTSPDARDFSVYDTMETGQLEQILRLDACAPDDARRDMETLLYIMGILAARQEKKRLLPWRAFKKRMVRRPGMLLWLRRLTASAAASALLILIPVSGYAFKRTGGAGLIPKWDHERFYYEGAGIAEPVATEGVSTGYTSFSQMLLDHGRDPTGSVQWIPQGFELSAMQSDILSSMEIYYSHYTDGERNLMITAQVRLAPVSSASFVDGDTVRIYRFDNREFYIFYNGDTLCAFWTVGNVEHAIYGDLTMKQLKRMIRSTAEE